MKKREFLAMSGAVPLMLAGCGGDGTGSAPVRLVNASVGYESGLGFMVQTTQATSQDVPYGSASPFETVQAGQVTTSLTVNSGGTNTTVSSNVRTLSKDSRYSLVAFGFQDELKSLLVTESTVTPDSGEVNINVLNTSLDIGPVDVYLSTSAGTDLALSQQIASAVGGQTQSSFFPVLPGTYFITVVGAGSVAAGRTDIRFQSAVSNLSPTNQQIVSIILTPGASGTLANVIVLTQGTNGAATSFLNSTARLRVVTAVPKTSTVTVTGVLTAGKGPQPTQYVIVNIGSSGAGPVPTITVGSTPITTITSVTTTSTATVAATSSLLQAGGDYTLLVYTDPTGADATGQATLIQDDNTAPVGTTGVKYRLINLVYNDTGLTLRMTVNSVEVASGVTFGKVTPFQEIATPQNIASVVSVYDSTDLLVSEQPQTLGAGNIFTEVLVSLSTDTPPVVGHFFLSTFGATT